MVVPAAAVLILDGLQLPEIPLLEVVCNGGGV
jgi:hypothetical protein